MRKTYTKPDYYKKGEALRQGYVEAYKKLSKELYNNPSYELLDNISKLCANNELFKEAGKINHAHLQRVIRLKKRIGDYLTSGDIPVFITLTFNNICLSKTSEETRKKYVSRFLRSISTKYVANIDYGELNQREHYHAVIVVHSLDDLRAWEHGFYKVETVRFGYLDTVRLSKYIAKLTNHAIKRSNKRCALIYSKAF